MIKLPTPVGDKGKEKRALYLAKFFSGIWHCLYPCIANFFLNSSVSTWTLPSFFGHLAGIIILITKEKQGVPARIAPKRLKIISSSYDGFF